MLSALNNYHCRQRAFEASTDSQLHLDSARSLNVRIKPYGFEFKSGKILSIGQDADGGTPSPNGEEGEASGEAASPTNAKAPKAPKAPKTPKTPKAAPRSKKRKLDDAAMESDDAVVKGEDVEEDAVKDEDNNSGIDN